MLSHLLAVPREDDMSQDDRPRNATKEANSLQGGHQGPDPDRCTKVKQVRRVTALIDDT